jgi:hypothetical protein
LKPWKSCPVFKNVKQSFKRTLNNQVMIEVFKTNVEHSFHADMLVDEIHQTFSDYSANFDLEDCDKILRVENSDGVIEPSALIDLLKNFGFYAEVLADEVITISDIRLRQAGIHLLQ